MRENTERPETIEVGANVLAGTGSQRILDGARKMHGRELAGRIRLAMGLLGRGLFRSLGISAGLKTPASRLSNGYVVVVTIIIARPNQFK